MNRNILELEAARWFGTDEMFDVVRGGPASSDGGRLISAPRRPPR
jgi:hypothetical protein